MASSKLKLALVRKILNTRAVQASFLPPEVVAENQTQGLPHDVEGRRSHQPATQEEAHKATAATRRPVKQMLVRVSSLSHYKTAAAAKRDARKVSLK